MSALLEHQLLMLREALPGSHAAKLRSLLQRRANFGVRATCDRGHPMIMSTGDCYGVVETSPGLYEYVHGCDEVASRCR